MNILLFVYVLIFVVVNLLLNKSVYVVKLLPWVRFFVLFEDEKYKNEKY